MAKRKKTAIFLFLSNRKELSPNASIKDLFSIDRNKGGHFGKVKAYNPNTKEAPDAT
jgi:hypothetical protein